MPVFIAKVFVLLDTGSSIALLKAVNSACDCYSYFLRTSSDWCLVGHHYFDCTRVV